MKRIPPALRERYFARIERNGHFRVNDILRDRICYQKHDLLSLEPIGENFRSLSAIMYCSIFSLKSVFA